MNEDDQNSTPDRKPPANNLRLLQIMLWVMGITVIILLMSQYVNPQEESREISLDNFFAWLHDGTIETVNHGESSLSGKLQGKKHSNYVVQITGVSPETLSNKIKDEVEFAKTQGRTITWRPERNNSLLYSFLINVVPWIALFLLMWFLFIRPMRNAASGNMFSFGKSRAQLVTKEKIKTTFSDVAGVDEAKEEVKEIIEFLKNPTKFTSLGARIPSGVLLVGAPGTGKTLLAKAIAGEASVPFFSICGSDFVEMFVGVGASRVRDLFLQAKENSPCVIFLDEIDAVGRRRGTGLGGGHDEREQTLNAILVEMDGFNTDSGVIVIAATNRPDVLDPALLRAGRFDRQITVDMPDVKGREEILRVHTRKAKISQDVDLKAMAKLTPNFSGADLENLVNEAIIIAASLNKTQAEMTDFEQARDKVLWGREKKSRVMDEKDRKIIAYHEAGHAMMTMLSPDADPLHKISIIPRGPMLGATMQFPEKDTYNVTRRKLLAQLRILYSGRIAEELFCDDITTGAQNDISRATDIARRMVCEWGMSDTLGPITYRQEEEHLFLGREIAKTHDHSEQVSQAIDYEIKRLTTAAYSEAKELLEQHRDELQVITGALLEFEVLSAEEVRKLLAGEKLTSREPSRNHINNHVAE